MGAGSHFDSGKFFHETGDTRSAGREDAFDKLVAKLTANAEITSDEEVLYYREAGNREEETGTERIIEFEMGDYEWEIKRIVEDYKVTHHGVEELDDPIVQVTLRKRSLDGGGWENVDLSGMM